MSLWGNLATAFDEESKHSRFFEGKASRISQKDGVFLSRHFYRSYSSFRPKWRNLNYSHSESRKLSGSQRHSTKSLCTPDSSREKQVESLRKTENTVILTNLLRCSPPNIRHPDEPCTLLSTGRIDKVSHKVPDSSREKYKECLRKTEYFYHVIQTEAIRHFDRSGEISTNNNCKFFLLNEISRFHFIPLEMTGSCHFNRNFPSSWRTLHAALHRKDRQSISSTSSS